ncbi:Odorant binding protein 7 [Cephus cinctus]|uniref:Uncharacterized protein LOC107265458 n=1 Tax=Cephus cinctus TaxID=211228 RepID=A0A3L9LTV8_CEPCN|nr:uncharacterized protein LOC107265458 [Cephus cinctus]RLZ02172.1 Odorant binding protein 7 [Cephus cinctus]
MDHRGESAFDQTTWTEVKKYCKQQSAVPQKFSNYERIFSKSGYFPADEEFQCYLACLAVRSDLMILGNELSIDWRKLKPLFPKGKAFGCQKRATEQDPCKKAYQYFNCLRKGNNAFQEIDFF